MDSSPPILRKDRNKSFLIHFSTKENESDSLSSAKKDLQKTFIHIRLSCQNLSFRENRGISFLHKTIHSFPDSIGFSTPGSRRNESRSFKQNAFAFNGGTCYASSPKLTKSVMASPLLSRMMRTPRVALPCNGISSLESRMAFP